MAKLNTRKSQIRITHKIKCFLSAEMCFLVYGVPQGSDLGPTLFYIFNIDLPHFIHRATIEKLADAFRVGMSMGVTLIHKLVYIVLTHCKNM